MLYINAYLGIFARECFCQNIILYASLAILRASAFVTIFSSCWNEMKYAMKDEKII